MSDKPNEITLEILQGIITEAIKQGATLKSRIALSSDEEGNQVNYMWAWTLEDHGSWEQDGQDFNFVPDPEKGKYVCFWPSHEEVDP